MGTATLQLRSLAGVSGPTRSAVSESRQREPDRPACAWTLRRIHHPGPQLGGRTISRPERMRKRLLVATGRREAAAKMLQCKISDILRRSNPSRGPDRWRNPMFWRDWARKDLQRGDLNALVELKRGWGVPSPVRLERLGERGFIEQLDDHKLRVTVKGRVTLLLGRR